MFKQCALSSRTNFRYIISGNPVPRCSSMRKRSAHWMIQGICTCTKVPVVVLEERASMLVAWAHAKSERHARRGDARALPRVDPAGPTRFGHPRRALSAAVTRLWPAHRASERAASGRGKRAPNDHMPIHTSVHTTFTGSTHRPQTRHGRAVLAPEISGSAGRVRIRPRGRTRPCEACTRSGTAGEK